MSFNYSNFQALKAYSILQRSFRKDKGLKSYLETYLVNNVYGIPLNQEIKSELDNYFYPNYKEPCQYLGIEVEVENSPRDLHNLSTVAYWGSKEDGSLRNNGREFVTFRGLTTDTYKRAVKLLNDDLLMGVSKPIANARTGLHIHMDVSEKPVYDVANILFLYSIFEPIFFKVSGNREDNIFCLPWYKNSTTLGDVLVQVTDYAQKSRFNDFRWRNYSKYCGLNLSTIAQYGTLEFRMHKGTYNPDDIEKWVDTLTNLFDVAQKDIDLEDAVQLFRNNRRKSALSVFANRIFKPYGNDILNQHNDLYIACLESLLTTYKSFVDPTTSEKLKSKSVNLFGKGKNYVEFPQPDINGPRGFINHPYEPMDDGLDEYDPDAGGEDDRWRAALANEVRVVEVDVPVPENIRVANLFREF
jgi:hypothetical protein